MSRKGMVVAGCLVDIVTLPAFAQQDFDKVEIRTTRITERIYMLDGAGGNIAVSVGSDGVLMVDDQFAPLAGKILAAIEALGGQRPKYILNTHWHGDHTGGNAAFGPHGTIIAHATVRERLSSRQELFGQVFEPVPKEALPVITFEDGLSIHFNDEEVRVVHLPGGHTDGDCVVFFTRSNVVHMGDLFFMGMFPFVDLDHGGDVEGVIRNVEKVLDRVDPKATIIPGHGPLSTVEDLRTYHRMMTECVDRVKKGIAAGKTLGDIRAGGVPDEWKSWGNDFIKTEQWLGIIHRSLTRNAQPVK